jgi:hypothetical protein
MMLVTLKATRVYATKDQFGPEPRFQTSESPYQVTYPNGDSGELVVGPAPEWAYEARRIMIAVGSLMLNGILRGEETSVKERPARIREILAEIQSQHQREIESFSTFTTAVVERDIEVGDDLGSVDEFIWWDWRDRIEDIERFDREAKDALDYMALVVALRVGGTMPGQLIFERTYFTAAERTAFAIPRYEVSGADMHVTSKDRISDAGLQAALDAIAVDHPRQSHLPEPAHWYLAARGESDQWKRFLWAFWALDRLVEDAAAVIRQRPDYQQQLAAAKSLDPAMTKKSLKLSFALVGTIWSPTTVAADLPRFKAMADVRGDLSHGVILAADQLPTPEVLSLLEHYMRLIYGV